MDADVYPNLQQPPKLSETTYFSASNESVWTLLFVEPKFCLDNFSGSFYWVEQIWVHFPDHFVLNLCKKSGSGTCSSQSVSEFSSPYNLTNTRLLTYHWHFMAFEIDRIVKQPTHKFDIQRTLRRDIFL